MKRLRGYTDVSQSKPLNHLSSTPVKVYTHNLHRCLVVYLCRSSETGLLKPRVVSSDSCSISEHSLTSRFYTPRVNLFNWSGQSTYTYTYPFSGVLYKITTTINSRSVSSFCWTFPRLFVVVPSISLLVFTDVCASFYNKTGVQRSCLPGYLKGPRQEDTF